MVASAGIAPSRSWVNDIPATVKAFDPQIEWTEPAEYPGGGTYHGHAGVEAHLSQSRGSWAEGSCEPERFIVADDKGHSVRSRASESETQHGMARRASSGCLHLPQRQGRSDARIRRQAAGSRMGWRQSGYSQLTVASCLVNGFTPRVGRRW